MEHKLSTLEFAFRQRPHVKMPGGSYESERNFLDFIVDGQSLSERTRYDLVSVLCKEWVPEEREGSVRRLLGEEAADFPDDRRSILVCPERGDIGCGAVSAVVDFSRTRPLDGGTLDIKTITSRRSTANISKTFGPFEFDLSDYKKKLIRALDNTMKAEIIAVGSELLTPDRLDTNSLFLTEELNKIGIEVVRKTVVGDNRDLLSEAFRDALNRVELVIASGGLGPTEDDLTRETVAELLHRKLRRNDEILRYIEGRFRALNREMPEVNVRQAMVPEGAEILENPRGTAPGLWLEDGGHFIVLLPGPPRELKPLFREQVLPRLERRASSVRLFHREIRVTGSGRIARRAANCWHLQTFPRGGHHDTRRAWRDSSPSAHLDGGRGARQKSPRRNRKRLRNCPDGPHL